MSTHWDDPNVLAHMRVQDRMIAQPPQKGFYVVNKTSGRQSQMFDTPEELQAYVETLPESIRNNVTVAQGERKVPPRKVLQVEEIQSDWHQAGRKKGYRNQEAIDKVSEKYKPDIIIDATGYPSGISLLGYNDEIPKLYKNIIVPGLTTIGCIGYVASFNWIQTSDLQARWLFNVFLNKISLPSTKMEQYQWIGTVRREDYHDLAYEIYDYCEMLYADMPYKKHIPSWRDWITTPEYDRWV